MTSEGFEYPAVGYPRPSIFVTFINSEGIDGNMPSKKRGGDIITCIKDFFKEFAVASIRNTLQDGLRETLLKLKGFIYSVEKRMIKDFYLAVISISGVIFILIASAMLLEHYLRLVKGFGFMIVGVAVLLVAGLIRYFARDNSSCNG
ncbi:hypothetical protein COT48_01320 [Candidatus Woesearchaeota archaeon CG08_land_8_20_14_0_20_47_9]|nr:MAG: hypothetical protein AUJ69_04430 [Candidatus Woesearchaeota archaeon CG1_02_47_18]PIN72757.1 MAG: hypothetical protein COV22_02365 [Candidatus Woesearchaeota archaeon CG10_big_fil_rev_8_21_14_0_10_47_5]PIO04272.1 MAG: hypothetical protein COT48_01320 [Candidatus Woesearchaeota archaeon CG08_land_8_20_14_0_20_47_9]